MNPSSRGDGEARKPQLERHVHVLFCVECGSQSGLHARGWRAYRLDDAGSDLPPMILFFCPTCASRIFD